MVKLNKIYTKTGDTGESGLVGGARRAKHDVRFEAIGDVDETNALIGIARLHVTDSNYDAMLKRIQHDLFDLGADLATLDGKTDALRITAVQVTRLEHEIDHLNESLSPLNSFVLPGGTKASAYLHLARTVTRRAERVACALASRETINPEALKYINRLSDFLFVLARVTNGGGTQDVLWEPGINR
jgi:cob(I)alamin adenosyltransferase